MEINHNIRAMVTQHALYSNNNAMTKSLEKLSTGLRINRAQDDAAGLAMSEQMRTQIRGLGKAKQNSQDSIAALQIAEGGLQEITNIMQRQRELAVQAANDTLTSTERKYLNDEFKQLNNEIARISRTTDYNGKNMLNWDEDPNKSFGAIGGKDTVLNALKEEKSTLEKYLAKISAAAGDFTKTGDDDGWEYKVPGTNPITYSATEKAKAVVTSALKSLQEFIDAVSSGDYDNGAKFDDAATTDEDKRTIEDKFKSFQNAISGGGHAYDEGEWDDDVLQGKSLKSYIDAVLADSNASAKDKEVFSSIYERLETISKSDSNESPIVSLGGLAVKASRFESASANAASYTLHIGANYSFGLGGKWGNEMTVTYVSISLGSLGLDQRNIKTQNNATDAIDQLDKVIKSVSGARAKIGTFINRLEYTINNVANLEFNTQDAESRIRDTDFAKETTNFTRNQIVVQAATSMLAQANSLPQSVLGLLG